MTAKPGDSGVPSTGSGGRVPLRRCVVCRASTIKGDLLRFARDANGDWQLDLERRAGGRGAWLCRTCAAEATARELKRFFKGQASAVAGQLDASLARGSSAPAATPASTEDRAESPEATDAVAAGRTNMEE